MNQRDKYSIYDKIILNEGAYFFKRGNDGIDNKVIDNIFNKVLEGKNYKIWVVKKRKEEILQMENEIKAYCSLLLYSSITDPSFLDSDTIEIPVDMKERKSAYLLIMEINDYVVIIKKNISHLSSFINSLNVIDGKTLSNALVTSDTLFQQMKLTNMNMNEDAVRNKVYEAHNLENAMPMFGANQNIVTSTRFENINGICTLNVNTSRISKFGQKKNIKNLIKWSVSLISAIEDNNKFSNFLLRFATPVVWSRIYTDLKPVSILINWYQLVNYLERLEDNRIYRKIDDVYSVSTELFEKLKRIGYRCLDVIEEDGLYHCKGFYKSIGVKLNKQGIKLTVSQSLSNLFYIKDDGTYVKLIDLINNESFFSVCFSNYSYIYTGRRLYNNASINQDLDSILSVFETFESMNDVTSEKGTTNQNSTEFSDKCVFNVVENDIFPDADFLVCDDMGNEWADHIAIKNNTISFIHSKCLKKTSLSASSFQEVIGQAVKNIANLSPSEEALRNKLELWNSCMNNTSIQRCRKGTAINFINRFKSLQINPNLTKEVCIAIDFISKVQLEEAFHDLKENIDFRQKNSVIQMVWLLNGFISICKDADLHCRVFCKP